ncbi:MFS transporter [Paenibacillus spiritus]|uniref:MFS transporter n=1 Tax=Paenibacillus spiritus TaxID=2496557 RepID=A0A5J5GJY2_9BACL|nr:MFS transporter [Paenibacillus spiritus]KAA9008390.1 MFS transporter [Paenibacillus spiritus]
MDQTVKPSYRSLLSLSNYRMLLASQVVSALGDGVYAIALIWIMKEISGSSFLMSVLIASETVPLLIFGLFAGIIVDRGNKKRIMIMCDIARGIMIAFIAAMLMAGLLKPYMLIMASFGAFFTPSRTVAVRTLVPGEQMMQAQSLAQMIQTLVGLVAPAFGALLLHYDASYAFLFNAATFMGSALLLTLIRSRPLVEKSSEKLDRSGFARDFKEGILAVTAHPLLRNLILYLVLINFMLAPTTLLFPLIVGDSTELALFEILFVIGITAGVFSLNLLRRMQRIVLLAAGIALMLAGLGALTWIHHLYAELVCVFIVGLGSPLANVTLQTLFVLKVPQETLGRASSLMKVLLEASRPLSTLLAGVLILSIPVRSFFAIMAVFGMIVLGLMLLNPSIRQESSDLPSPGSPGTAGAVQEKLDA